MPKVRGRKPTQRAPKVSITVQLDPDVIEGVNTSAREVGISRTRWIELALRDILLDRTEQRSNKGAPAWGNGQAPARPMWDGASIAS